MLIEQFLDYMRHERNKAPLTIECYGADLRLFRAYMASVDDTLTLEIADSDIIRGWMESMMDKGGSATSINRRLSALRSFYRFALSRGAVSADPTRLIRGPKKKKVLPQYVRESEIDRLLDTYEWGDTYIDVRARTIIICFYETGIRLSELTGLDDGDVDLVRGQLKVTGKRNKQRIVPFGEELKAALKAYMELRNGSVTRTDNALFATEKGKRMTPAQVREEVKGRIALVSTMKKRSPHVLRHSFATAMLNHGAGLESIRQLLGHASLDTTTIYAHTTFEQLRREYNHAHPRA